MIKPIVKEPNPLLHQKAIPVGNVTAEIEQLIDAMIETVHAAQGVGLAANQIGSPLNILVVSADGEKGKELVLLNATVLERRGRFRLPEGCLSVPGVSAEVARAASVKVNALDRQGQPITLEAEGLLAKILQHETDHLQGHLFLERIGLWERRRLLKKYESLMRTLKQVQV